MHRGHPGLVALSLIHLKIRLKYKTTIWAPVHPITDRHWSVALWAVSLHWSSNFRGLVLLIILIAHYTIPLCHLLADNL